MTEQEKKLSELTEGYEPLPHVLLNVSVQNKGVAKLAYIQRRVEELSAGCKIILRASGTEPVVRIFCEGENLSDCKIRAEILKDCLLNADRGQI